MNSKYYLKEKLQYDVDILIKQQNCEHTWYPYGHGYECFKCNYYTGQHTELNDIIKIEIDRVKKLERIVDEKI